MKLSLAKFKSVFLLQIIYFPIFFSYAKAEKDSLYKLKTIVIDAGHGGYDPGAKGKFSLEKNITLKVALELGNLIKSKFRDVKVVYTRSRDEFVPLYKRTAIANKKKANLFISIHCNACTEKSAYGVETYIMNVQSIGKISDIAKRENEVILLEDRFEKNYEGFNPKSIDSYIILSQYHNSNHNNSLHLAQKIQNHVGKKGRRNRGVRQEQFLIFWKLTPTGILIEIGFITNPQEEVYMNSDSGRKTIVEGIFSAIEEYKLEMDKSLKTNAKTPIKG
jgi:N-acetylmuramoyl-L-alanine amidase